MDPYRIVLADDHVLLRQGLKRIIEESRELVVVGEAGDGLELIAVLEQRAADLVILDISMPKLPGIEALPLIKRGFAAVKALVLTMHREKEYLHQAFSAGADGYLLKEDADTELFSAIDALRRGESFVSPCLEQEYAAGGGPANYEAAGSSGECAPLSFREREVLTLIAEGKASREIAGLLQISVRTAEHHRANIMDKLKLRKTADLVKYAVSKGYVPLSQTAYRE